MARHRLVVEFDHEDINSIDAAFAIDFALESLEDEGFVFEKDGGDYTALELFEVIEDGNMTIYMEIDLYGYDEDEEGDEDAETAI